MALTIMGFLNFIVFSILIILNIANINTDPPYWIFGSTIIVAIGMYFSAKQNGRNHWNLLLLFVIFLFLYLSRIHTVPYFGLPLDGMLDGTFFEDGPWGRMWIFYGGFALAHLLMWRANICKFAKSEQEAKEA